jgi:hypothetical protein
VALFPPYTLFFLTGEDPESLWREAQTPCCCSFLPYQVAKGVSAFTVCNRTDYLKPILWDLFSGLQNFLPCYNGKNRVTSQGSVFLSEVVAKTQKTKVMLSSVVSPFQFVDQWIWSGPSDTGYCWVLRAQCARTSTSRTLLPQVVALALPAAWTTLHSCPSALAMQRGLSDHPTWPPTTLAPYSVLFFFTAFITSYTYLLIISPLLDGRFLRVKT